MVPTTASTARSFSGRSSNVQHSRAGLLASSSTGKFLRLRSCSFHGLRNLHRFVQSEVSLRQQNLDDTFGVHSTNELVAEGLSKEVTELTATGQPSQGCQVVGY